MSAPHGHASAASPTQRGQTGQARPSPAARFMFWRAYFSCAFACLVLVAPRSTTADEYSSSDVPVSRLMLATEVALDRVGRQPRLLYRLARLHYITAILGETCKVQRRDYGQYGPAYPLVDSGEPVVFDPNPRPVHAVHIRAAMALFKEVTEVQPDHGMAWLGLATLVEQSAASEPVALGALPGDATPSAAVPISVQEQRWVRQAATYYGQAASAFTRQGEAALIGQDSRWIMEFRRPTDQGKRFLEAADAWHRLARRFRLVDRPTWAAMERRVRRAARNNGEHPIIIQGSARSHSPLTPNSDPPEPPRSKPTAQAHLSFSRPRGSTVSGATPCLVSGSPQRSASALGEPS